MDSRSDQDQEKNEWQGGDDRRTSVMQKYREENQSEVEKRNSEAALKKIKWKTDCKRKDRKGLCSLEEKQTMMQASRGYFCSKQMSARVVVASRIRKANRK